MNQNEVSVEPVRHVINTHHHEDHADGWIANIFQALEMGQ